MKGVLGGFRNMLRTWRNNLRRRKKQKEKEIQEGKLTKFYTLKRLSYNTLALIYYPIGILLHSDNVKKKTITSYPKLRTIELKLDELQKNKQSVSAKQIIKEIQNIDKELSKIKTKLNKEVNPVIQQELKQAIEQINKKKESVMVNATPKKTTSVQISNKASAPKKTAEVVATSSGILQPITKQPPIKKVNRVVKPNKEHDITFIKEKNKEFEEWQYKLAKLENKINNAKYYNELYDYQVKLQELETKFKKLKEELQHHPFLTTPNIYIDANELQKSPKKIDETLKHIENTFKLIEIKKKEIYYKKETKKTNQEKQQEVKKKEDKPVVTKQKEVDELKITNQIILENIRKQQKMLQTFQREINKSKNRQKTLFSYLTNLSNQIIRLLFSPFRFVKNGLLGKLMTSILVNNSLKSMRKMIHNDKVINYEIMRQEYQNGQTILEEINRVCLDSLNQITDLREDLQAFNNGTNNLVVQLLKQLDDMEIQILKEQMNAKMQGHIIHKDYMKVIRKNS